MRTACLLSLTAGLMWAAEGSFERTLRVDGAVDLHVPTGSGSITVRTGGDSAVRVYGRIRVSSRRLSESEAADRVRRLESNPPIEQTGNIIRIGQIQERDLRENVSISYEVVTPAQTRLRAQTGSGSQTIEGMRGPVDAATGSGSLLIRRIADGVTATTGSGGIELRDIQGRVRATTGSGGVRMSLIGSGDVEASTGSGTIEISGAKAALRAHTGSGSISVDGAPGAGWRLETASGSVRLRLPPDAAFDLQARTSSGRISVDHPLTVQGQVGRHHVVGKVRGGGTLVALSTASGNITIE
jgi:DUF4097 and DUF4098 domain-containing protein YvlB